MKEAVIRLNATSLLNLLNTKIDIKKEWLKKEKINEKKYQKDIYNYMNENYNKRFK